MKLTAKERITRAKINIYDEAPFLSYIINHLQYIEDNTIPTMGVDNFGRCYYSKKFVSTLNDEELMGVLAHEALHCALEHLNRLDKRDREIWNIATDILVNNMLLNQDMQLPDVGIKPKFNTFVFEKENIKIENIDKKFAESIYNELLQQIPKKKKNKIVIKLKGFDDHRKEEKQKGKGSNGNTIEIEMDETDWKKVLAEANTFAKQKGKGSKQLDRIVEAALSKKINWKHMLSRFMRSDIMQDYSYARPSKRSYSAGAYLPYISRENMNVTIAIDTSGSIQEKELSEFMGQVYSIVKSFNNIQLTLLFHDDKIVKEEKYTNMNLRQILKVKPCGGGGTSHQEVMDYTKKNNVNVLVCFTDGYSDINIVNNKFKRTIFVLTEQNCEKPNYGRVVYYTKGDLK